MNLSPGSVLTFNLAALETVLSRCKEIGPEHLFLALCKVCDLSTPDIKKMVKVTGNVVDRITDEASAVGDMLKEGDADPTQTRRRLRRLIGKETPLHGTFGGHRSQRCRELCRAAETRALAMGEANVQPVHFLWAVLSDFEEPK